MAIQLGTTNQNSILTNLRAKKDEVNSKIEDVKTPEVKPDEPQQGNDPVYEARLGADALGKFNQFAFISRRGNEGSGVETLKTRREERAEAREAKKEERAAAAAARKDAQAEKMIKMVLSILGFNVSQLDVSGLKDVDFMGYLGQLLAKELNNPNLSLKDIDISGAGDAPDPSDFSDYKEAIAYIKGLPVEQQQAILDAIVEKAPFLLEGTYKDYADYTPTQEIKDRANTCAKIAAWETMGQRSEINEAPWEVAKSYGNSETGIYTEAFINPETKELIIQFNATNSALDAVTDDLTMMTGGIPDQYPEALQFVLDIMNDPAYADYQITVTGHSLGASLAELVACSQEVVGSGRDVDAFTFNAFGIADIVANANDGDGQYKFDLSQATDDIYNFITEDDLVSCSSPHVGNTTCVPNEDQLVPHMMVCIQRYLNA